MSIEIGDAILKFLGDSTQLDTKFAEVGPKAEAAFDPAAKAAEGLGDALDDAGKKADDAADEIEDAGKRTKVSMGEARGEVALLGEAFGIHLPRHVRSFVAELPGVGTALEAAFSATAILFLAQAVAQVAEKISKFTADTFVFTEKMKEQTKEIIKQNVEIAKQSDLYRAAEAELNKLNDQRTPLQKLTDQLKALNDERDKLINHPEEGEDVLQKKDRALQEQIKLLEKQIELQKEADEKEADKKALASLKEQITLQKDLTLAVLAYHAAEFQGQNKSNLEEAQFQAKLQALQKEKAAEEKYNADNLAGIERLNNQIKVLMVERGTQVAEELNKERATLNATFQGMSKDVKTLTDEVQIELPAGLEKTVNNMLTMERSAHSLGITLRSDLVQAVAQAITALHAYQAAGGTSTVVTDAFKKKIAELQHQLDQFGKTQDTFKGKTDNTWRGFQQDLHNGANAMQNLGQMGSETFDKLAGGLQSAIQTAILAQGSFSQAMKRATEDALASLASQAIVKALFYTAEGFAMLAQWPPGIGSYSAAQYFEAAGVMAAVGGAAGVAAHAMAGGSGTSSSNSNAQGHTTNSNTGQENRSGNGASGVQMFAEGGLVTEPTLAIIGEQSRKEAVLPLDDPEAMDTIGKSIGANGGTTHHWHIEGMISPDNLQKVVGKISKMVNKGQVNLTASNSLRLTKRSA